jgi:hypothetical protein
MKTGDSITYTDLNGTKQTSTIVDTQKMVLVTYYFVKVNGRKVRISEYRKSGEYLQVDTRD